MTHVETPVWDTGVAAGRPFRLGFLGSPEAATRIAAAVRAAVDGLAVDLVEARMAEPFAPLRAGAVDALVIRFRIVEPDLVVGPVLYTEDRVLAVGAGHPLARRDAVDSEDIADYEVFERPGDFPADVYDQLVPRWSVSGRRIRRTHRTESVAGMLALVAGGAAVHPTLGSMRAHDANGAVRYVPIRDLPSAPVAITWRGANTDARVPAFVATAARAFGAGRP
jgi:DNA-binding transcriptional LysR family regulator